jgi:DNA-binding beta-propeller fold protein YncE
MRVKAAAAGAVLALALLGTAPLRHGARSIGTFRIDVPAGPYISGSRVTLTASGVDGRIAFSVLGPGSIEGTQYIAPRVTRKTKATIIGSAAGALAQRNVEIVPAPSATQPLLAVATYHDGIALHDPRTFALIGYVPIGGAPGDVAFDRFGRLVAPDTDSDMLTSIDRDPWKLNVTHGVLLGNEVAVDEPSGNIFVSNRDAGGFGALTRITPQGTVARVKTGDTAEGLAIDAARQLVYVGNVNDNSVAVVDARSMRVVKTIRSVERTFGIALDTKAQRLFVVSNTSPSMPQRSGYVAAIDLDDKQPRIELRSARMIFPLGAVVDQHANRLFVTDEVKNGVFVLSTKTLRPLRAPLQTCDTPWRPRIERGRLYVPCAQANEVDVFDLRTLRRVHGAPFRTGGFPLGVALWP